MADLIQINNFTNKYSDNLLSDLSLFKVEPTINFIHSSFPGGLEIVDNFSLSANMKSAELSLVQNNQTSVFGQFDFGDALSCEGGGAKIFQFSIFPQIINANPDYTVNIELDLFGDGLLVETFTIPLTLTDLEYKFYTFAQSFDADGYNELNFRFRVQSDSVVTTNQNIKLNFSGFKIESDDKFLGFPTPYSFPTNIFIEKGKQQFGLYNFQHAGATQSITANTWTDIINDGSGELTSIIAGYDDVDIYNTSTNLISLEDLKLYDTALLRFQANVTTTSNNQTVKVRVLLSVGGLNQSLPFLVKEYDVLGLQDDLFADVPINIFSELTRTYPAKLQIWSSHDCTLDLDGFNFKVQKRLL